MTELLVLQGLYVLAGTLFNMISLTRERKGLCRLTPTNPVAGLRAMTIASCILISFFLVPPWAFALAWSVFSARLLIRAVIPHFLAVVKGRNIENYASESSARLAFSINLSGSIFGLWGGFAAMA